MPTRIEASCACADLSWARAASRRACDVCRAVGEMKFCAARPTLAVFWRSASTSAACADSTRAARSATRLCISARSITPITWPALTRLPSATLSDEQRPRRLGADDGGARRDQRSRELERQRQPRGDRPGDLGGDELERDRLLLVLVAAAQDLGQHGGGDRGDGDARPRAPIQIRRFALWAGAGRSLEICMAASVGPRPPPPIPRATGCESAGPSGRRPRMKGSGRRPPAQRAGRSLCNARRQHQAAASAATLAAQNTAAKPSASLSAPPATPPITPEAP